MNTRLTKWLMRIYPRRFRHEWGSELEAFVASEYEDARSAGGRVWRVRFWLATYLDAVLTSVKLRLGRRRVVPAMTSLGDGFPRTLPVLQRPAGIGGSLQDVRLSVRGVIRQPGFHALAIATVALGVAATTAVFSVLDAVVLRPLPYPAADRLVAIGSMMRGSEDELGPMSDPDVIAFVERSRGLEAIAAVEVRRTALRLNGEPSNGRQAAVSAGFFDILGAQLAAGRLFDASDHEAGAVRVAMLTEGIWQTRYGGDPDIVGSTIDVDGELYVVVGVLDAGFTIPEVVGEVDLWTALVLDPSDRGSYGAVAIGRMRPGVTVDALTAELQDITADRYADGGPSFLVGSHAVGLREATIGDIGDTLWLLLAGVGLLLAIACVNVANLMLARGSSRSGEVAVRSALGASSWRIARQMLTESAVVSLVGGVLGASLAYAIVRLFQALQPGGIPRIGEVAIDVRVAAFALFVSALTGIVFGALPALQAIRLPTGRVLRDGGRAATSRGAFALRRALVITETALALVLAVAATLLVNSFIRLGSVDPGFAVGDLVALQLELRRGYNDPDAWLPFYDRLAERVRGIPGVRRAAVGGFVPFTDFPIARSYTPEGLDIPADQSVLLPFVAVGAGFVETLGVRVVEGRDFDRTDRARDGTAVMVNEAFVRQYWPGVDAAVGKRIKSGPLDTEDKRWFTVVGVLSDVRHRLVAAPTPTVYRPAEQQATNALAILARIEGDAAPILAAMRASVHELDPNLPVRRASTIEALAGASMVRPRFYSALAGGFGALALLLALVGIYGTATYTAGRRTREIGIRIALGAGERRVTRMFVLEGVAQTTAGVLIGVAAAVAGARLLERYLFGIAPTDAATFALAGTAVAVTAAVAVWVPARRAVRLDPMNTLREDG